MKTVVVRNEDMYKSLYQPEEVNHPIIPYSLPPKRSCFYDYGASNPVQFTGFVNSGDDPLIDELDEILEYLEDN